MSGTLLSTRFAKYFAGKKCVYASMRMREVTPLLNSVRDHHVDEGLLAAAHRVARACECWLQLFECLDPLAMAALRAHQLLERRGGRQIGEELAVILARGAVLEHRKRGAAHGAVAAVVENDREHRQVELVGDPVAHRR